MKKILIPILILLILVGLVSAATVVNLDPQGVLANATYQTSSTITYGFNVTGNQSTYDCDLYTTENGSSGQTTHRIVVTNYPTSNNTNTNFVARTDVADGTGTTNYTWAVFCNGLTDPTGAWSVNNTFGVDATDPVVTINYPTSNGAWYTTNTAPRIGLTVADLNADSCVLKTNLNTSSNYSGGYVTNFEIYSYTNNTAFNFTKINSSNAWDDNNTGAYLWEYECNDSAGNSASLGSNYTFYIDTVAPTAFAFSTSLWRTDNRNLSNATTATDYTPQIGWGATTEFNFSRYEVYYFKDAYGIYNSTTDLFDNVTTRTTVAHNISTLAADSDYFILVTAYDLAGNSVNMTTKNYKYSTDSTNRELAAGWNIIGNVGNAFNLSDLRIWTGATTVSYWNSTHEWQSHVSGGSYGAVSVGAGDAALIYMASATTLSDLIWNTTAVEEELTHNVTNQTASDWNLMMMRDDDDDKTLQELDRYLNCVPIGTGCGSSANNGTNVTYMSVYNNSASSGSKYIPFVGNWSINNATPLTFGNIVWMFLDASSSDITINWTAVS